MSDEDSDRWRFHLESLLKMPDATIVVGGVSGGCLSVQAGGQDGMNGPALVEIARHLLDLAQDHGGGACCAAALAVLPDPLADDEDSED